MTDDGQNKPELVSAPEPASGDIQGQLAVSKPDKLLRLGAMIREMLEEARRASLDEQGRGRMAETYRRSVEELKEILSPELQEELSELHLPFEGGLPTDSELRVAQAQLMGWLEGLFHGIQAALWAQHVAAQTQASQFPRRLPGAEAQQKSGYL